MSIDFEPFPFVSLLAALVLQANSRFLASLQSDKTKRIDVEERHQGD